MSATVCTIENCDGRPIARGWCNKHYHRWRVYGNPAYLPSREDRFWAKVEKTDTCWLWTAAKDPLGYGYFYDGTRTTPAYRYSYRIQVGPIPEGLHLDHLCRVPSCVNPAHLEPVTFAENLRRGRPNGAGINRAKTHCKWGHEFSPENTYIQSGGGRRCRTCARESTRNYLARKVA